MFHVSHEQRAGGFVHFILEGTLDKMHLGVVEGVVDEALKKGLTRYVLHCEGLRRVDDDGLRLLLRLKLAGAELKGLPWLVSRNLSLLESHSHDTK